MKQFLFLLLTFTIGSLKAQNGYNIKVTVENMPKTDSVYLAYYYGNQQYIQDTVLTLGQNTFTFKGKKQLQPGMYIVVLNKDKWFDLIIDKEQLFTIKANYTTLSQTLQFTNSLDNTNFYNYIKFLGEMGRKIEPYRAALRSTNDTTSESYKTNLKQITAIDSEVIQFQKAFKTANKKSLFVSILNGIEEPVIPPSPLNKDGKVDSTFPYRWVKGHYFDNFDLSDDRLCRTNIFDSKIKRYIDDLTPPNPDSVIASADTLLSRAAKAPENFKWILYWLSTKYEKPALMGMDKVFVHLSDKYFNAKTATWITPENLVKIKERADWLRNNLIGNQAPELIAYDTLNRQVKLSSIPGKLTVLYFYDPTCSHCQKVTPHMLELYDKWSNKGISFVGFSTQNDTSEIKVWKNYIVEKNMKWWNLIDVGHKTYFRVLYDIRTTPVIYLLDKNKKILAKSITWEQLDEIIAKELERKPG